MGSKITHAAPRFNKERNKRQAESKSPAHRSAESKFCVTKDATGHKQRLAKISDYQTTKHTSTSLASRRYQRRDRDNAKHDD